MHLFYALHFPGRVAEFDSPLRLLEDKSSMFTKLVSEYSTRASGITDIWKQTVSSSLTGQGEQGQNKLPRLHLSRIRWKRILERRRTTAQSLNKLPQLCCWRKLPSLFYIVGIHSKSSSPYWEAKEAERSRRPILYKRLDSKWAIRVANNAQICFSMQ